MLDGGRIVERGRHVDLLAHDGKYAAMWRRQQEAREHDASSPDEIVEVPAG